MGYAILIFSLVILVVIFSSGCTSLDSFRNNLNESGLPNTCGNSVIDNGELCDNPDLNGRNCQSFGFSNGTLLCTNCNFDTSKCFNDFCNHDLFCDIKEDYQNCPSDCEAPNNISNETNGSVIVGDGGISGSGSSKDKVEEQTQTSVTICQNAQNGGLCNGLDLTYGDGYKNLCCGEHGICC